MTGQSASSTVFFLSHKVYPGNETGFGFVEFESARVWVFLMPVLYFDLIN
jgi:hypothetical protein